MEKKFAFKIISLLALYTIALLLILHIKIFIIYTIILITILFVLILYLVIMIIKSKIEKEKRRSLERNRNMVANHTIFNFINTISYLCRKDTDKARESLLHLSNYIRKSFKSENEYWKSEEEISLIESYLFMQKIRFKNKMEINYLLEASDAKIKAYEVFENVKSYLEYSYKEKYKILNFKIQNNTIYIIRVSNKDIEENINIKF